MAFASKYLTFAKTPTSTGIQTISTVGFEGKVLLIWTTRQTAHGLAEGAHLNNGMTDGVTQVCRSIRHPDNEANTSSAQAERTDCLVYLTTAGLSGAPTLQVRGVFRGFTSDGFQIEWTDNDADATIFHCFVMAGVEAFFKEVKLTVTAPNTITATGVPFKPEAFIILGGAADESGTGDYALHAPFGSIHGFGFSNAVDNMCAWTLGRGTNDAADNYHGQHADRAVSIRTANLSGAEELSAGKIIEATENGFVFQRTASPYGLFHQPIQHIMCLRGVQFAMGSFSTPASPSTQDLSLPFQPDAMLMVTTGIAANGDNMGLAFGAWAGGEFGGAWIGGLDNVAPSVYCRDSYDDAVIKTYLPAATASASTQTVRMHVSDVGPGSATLVFITVPAVAVPILYLAIADSQTLSTLTYGSHRWAKVPVPNPVSHYGGYIQPRLKKSGMYMRALSDRTGAHELTSFQFTLKDVDRMMRIRAAGETSQFMDNCTVIARSQSDDDRRAFLTARTLGIGLIRQSDPDSQLTWTIRAEEYLSKFMGSARDTQQQPKRRFEYHIPGLPSALRGKSEPIRYGDLTSGASVTPPPILNLQWADGGFFNSNIERWGVAAWHLGWGTLECSADIPAGITVNVLGGGSINPGDGPLDLYNVAVTAVDSLGRESDPLYFNWHEPNYPYFGQITGGGQKIEVTWSPAAGAVGYRVYVGYAYEDTAFMRFQTFNTGVTIDRVVRFGETPTPTNVATGAEVITFSQSWIYAVSALMPDGETVLSPLCYGKSQGYQRPIKIQWLPVPGALEYRVYRREVKVKGLKLGGTEPAEEDSVWDRRWDIAAGLTSFSDDLYDTDVNFVEGTSVINGMVKVIPAGTETSLADGSMWLRFLVAAHAIYGIGNPATNYTGVFVDGELVGIENLGQTLLIPGWIGYSNFFPDTGSRCQYRDLNGRRYTFIYARGPVADAVAKGEKTGAVNLLGIESKGDSSGTLLRNIVDQYEHFMVNYGYGDYQTGDWEQLPPYWPEVTPVLRVMDRDTFAAAKAQTLARMGDTTGYVGGGCIPMNDGEFETLDDIIRDFNLSIDGNSYVNERAQFCIDVMDLTITEYTDQPLFTQAFGINKGTFKCKPSNEEWENYIPYRYRYNYQKQDYLESTFLDNFTSIGRYRETKKADEISLRFVQNGTVAANIIQHRLDRNAFKPYTVEFETTGAGLAVDLAEYAGFQTAEMIGTDPLATHLMRLERTEHDSDRTATTLTGRVRSLPMPE